jgi:predicted nucleic-acid-binding Zn-ribbon protein
MPEPWKVIICDSEKCMSDALNTDGSVAEEYKILPEIDTPEFTQFTCTRCGKVETWGVTRRNVAKIIYERTAHVRGTTGTARGE